MNATDLRHPRKKLATAAIAANKATLTTVVRRIHPKRRRRTRSVARRRRHSRVSTVRHPSSPPTKHEISGQDHGLNCPVASDTLFVHVRQLSGIAERFSVPSLRLWHRVAFDQVMGGGLPVPHLPPGVARIGQDRPHCGERPRLAGPVRVTLWIGRQRTGDSYVVQRPADPSNAVPGQPLSEDPLHDRRGIRVRLEPTSPPTSRGMCPVRVWARVHQPVPIWRTPPLIPALLADLRGHRCTHPDPSPGDLPLRLDT